MSAKKLESDALALHGVRHGFFTRVGGVSPPPYDSLNCGYGSGDDRAHVTANRQAVLAALGIFETFETFETFEKRALSRESGAALITPYQHHSADVITATSAWAPDAAPKGDAIITTEKQLAIGILTADCAPVLFLEPQAGIIGAAHAGWRGALGGVLEATVAAIVELGGERGRIIAAIGPLLGQQNFEVGPEFLQAFIDENADYARFFSPPNERGKPHFDLEGFCEARLASAGVGTIDALNTCTYAGESQFFSYRRNCHRAIDDYGRQISLIVQ